MNAGFPSVDAVLFQVFVVTALVLLNGFFVAFEFAVVKVRSAQLGESDLNGHRSARRAKEILANMDAYLSAAQLGITLTSLGLGWAGEPFVARLLGPVLASFGLEQPEVLRVLSFAVAFALITFLHIVVGEQAPKILAIRRALPTLLFCAGPMWFFCRIFRPFIFVINVSSGWLLRKVFRLEGSAAHESAHTTEELRAILEAGVTGEGAPVSQLGREILINALDMRKRVVRDIMTPRGEVVFLDLEDDFDHNLRVARDSGHTRFPLCRGHLDDEAGLIHIKDLLALIREKKEDLLSIKRELVHVPELMPLERLLKFLLGKRAHLALVLDEYGGAVGVVTLDNVLAELVGDIQDEFDEAQSECRQVGEGEYLLDGAVALHDLDDLIGLRVESTDVSTVGGYLTHLLGHLPRQGERVFCEGFEFTVNKTDGRRVVSVQAKRRSPLPASRAV
ncbi:MAG: hemolysin family protein [Chthoniobacterales bacterium]